MPILNPGPHDPGRHEHQEPLGAGDGYWLKETVRLIGHSLLSGEMLAGREAAELLGTTRQRVRQLADKGAIRRQQIGRHSFYPRVDLEAWAKLRDGGQLPTGRGHKVQPVFKAA